MITRLTTHVSLLVSCALLAVGSTPAQTAAQPVTYEYPPARWMTPIGFIDDWQKSLVLQDGALAYDFGPGPYARPTTIIRPGFDLPEGAESPSIMQTIADPRFPLIETTIDSDAGSLRIETFAVVPDVVGPARSKHEGFERLNGLTGSVAWARPAEGVDDVFRSVAWGTGRTIAYEVDVETSGRRRIALGFAEAHRKGRIKREQELRVEGAEPVIVDLMDPGEQNQPHVFIFDANDANGDGRIRVEVTASAGTQDPNTILNGVWIFAPDQAVNVDEIVSGSASSEAELVIDCGWELEDGAPSPRLDLALVEFGDDARGRHIDIRSRRRLAVHDDFVSAEGRPFVSTSPAPDRIQETDHGLVLHYRDDTNVVELTVAHGMSTTDSFPVRQTAAEERDVAQAHWHELDLKWQTIEVPDRSMQDLIEGSLRTIYQVRDVVDGYPQFQPGPTVYRGLWYGDGMWSVEGMTFIGETEAARLGVESMLPHQDETGRAGVMVPPLLHRETAHMIYAMGRYARLTQDRDWMERHWQSLADAMQHLADLRVESKQDPSAPYHGLFPPGLTDGGIGGINPEYGSTYWGMIAMAEAVRTAEWMNRTEEATEWAAELGDFLASFRRAAARDQRQDSLGNTYLPVLMNFDPEKNVPQRGQWGVVHLYYAGQLLEADDPLLQGTLAMLDSRTVEDHVVSLGWLTGGLWPIFEAHRGIAYSRLGYREKAGRLLYAFADHAAPTMVWAEEQMPRGEGTRVTGDIPHTIGNVQVFRLVRFMLAVEGDDSLEVLTGVPTSWLFDGATVRLSDAPTAFGPLTMELVVLGNTAQLRIEPYGAPIEVDTDALSDAGFGTLDGRPVPDHVRVDPSAAPTILVFER